MSVAIIDKVAQIMTNFSEPWCIAGGWALDAFLTRQTREHGDLEISIFREAQIIVRNYLMDYKIELIKNGHHIIPWPSNQYIEHPLHQLQVNSLKESNPINFDIMLDDKDKGEWVYRRNHKVKHSLDTYFLYTPTGIPYLCPEIVLLYKTKMLRPKDEIDFELAHSYLSNSQRDWLYEATYICYPHHPWLEKLKESKKYYNQDLT